MAFQIEVLTVDKALVPELRAAIQPLNLQSEFRFDIANERLLNEAYNFQQQSYTNDQVFEWLKDYRSKAGGNRPFIILVLNKPLSGRKTNLFGSHKAEHGLAWFTTETFDSTSTQFLFDRTRFCRYYLVRYILNFINPAIKVQHAMVFQFFTTVPNSFRQPVLSNN